MNPRRVRCGTCAVALAAVCAFSAAPVGAESHLGLFANGTRSNMDRSLTVSGGQIDYEGFEATTRWGLGGFAEFQKGSRFSVSIQPSVQWKGTSWTESGEPRWNHYVYLDAPIVARVMIGKKVRPYVAVGISPGLLLSANTNDTGGWWSSDTVESIKDDTTSYDVALVLGGGVRFPGAHGAFVEVTYQPGLIDTYRPASTGYSNGTDYTQKNRALLLTVGIRLK